MPPRRKSMRRTARRTSRRTSRRMERRMTPEAPVYEAPPPAPVYQDPAPAPAPAADPALAYMAELEQLASLRDAGVLSDEEFEAKKGLILGI